MVSRRALNYSNPRITEKIIDFADQDALCNALTGINTVFVTVGTTQQKVKGDMNAYRKVDYAIPVAAAEACVANGIASFLLVSSVGANSNSRNFYLRIKGEVEDAIAALPISCISIFQPSLLLGNRKEYRFGEKISQFIMPLLSFLMPSRYRPISAAAVAKAMVSAAQRKEIGTRRYLYSTINN